MKRFGWILVLLTVAAPAWAGKKSTVQELKDTLIALQEARKGDEDVATQLKQVELSEELTRATMNSLTPYLPGPLSTEQMYVLEGRSAVLAPPASDLPTTPAPDVATQKAILSKAVEYVTKTYMQNPHLTVSKSTTRFQDGVETIRTNSGMTSNMPNTDRIWATPNMFMRFLGTHAATVESDKGIELAPPVKQKTPWGQNGQVSEGGPGPILSVILQEAAVAGKLSWLRWETIGGKPAAVFSFAVDKKKSHYEVNYCCFPVTSDTGRMGYEGTDPNFQTGTDWKAFKTIVGYRGEFFIDPDTGVVRRLVTQAALKPTDFVHQEDMRIDYGPVAVGGKEYVLPVDSFTFTEVVPNGDNYAARYSVRHTLFNVTYANYRLAGTGQK
ncbi:MAG: hypothetical protein P4K86_09210 [Terracidiphilus sp.]|nr:hypothetical protein [Terracidiphilus sp.]MDR3777100.1 hypothetical protein [Terracidiphilus sp.]